MAEKDMTEKALEDYNDVFADIINGLLFGGEQIVSEADLETGTPRSVYKADGKLHEQERDIAKYWKRGKLRVRIEATHEKPRCARWRGLRPDWKSGQ